MNGDFLVESISDQSLKQINKMVQELNEGIEAITRMNKEFKKIKLPSQLPNGVSQVNEEVKKSNKIVSDYVKTQRKLANTEKQLIQSKSTLGKQIIKNREEIKRNNKATRDEINSRNKSIAQIEKEKKARERQVKSESDLRQRLLAQRKREESQRAKSIAQIKKQRERQNKLNEAYNKASSRLEILRRRFKNLAIQQELGIKLTDAQEKEMRQLGREASKLDSSLKKVDKVVGQSQRNVGNYKSALGGLKGVITGLVGTFGIIEGLRFSKELINESIALAREAKGVQFAFARLGDEGVDAFNRVKISTRGLLSDLDIKKSLVEFDNFNLSLKESDTLFEFLSVRAAQTGKSVDSLKDSLVEGLSKESKLRIDNLGISASELNAELEKTPDFVQAVANIARREVAEAGNILDETANTSETLNASLENTKIAFGQLFTGSKSIPILGLLSRFFNKLTKDLKLFRLGLDRIKKGINDFLKSIPFLSSIVGKLSSSFGKFFKILGTSGLRVLSITLSVLGASLSGVGAIVPIVKKEILGLIETMKLLGSILINPITAAKSLTNGNFKKIFNKITNDTAKAGENISSAFSKAFKDAMIISGEENSITLADSITGEDAVERVKKNVEILSKAIKEATGETLVTDSILNGLVTADDNDLLETQNRILARTVEEIDRLREAQQALANEKLFESFGRLESELGIQAGTFEALFEQIGNGFKDVEKSAESFGNIATGVFSEITAASNQRLENERVNLQIEKDTAIEFAGDSQAAREEIEERFDSRQREIRRKQVQNERAQALFEIGISTAVGVIKALAMTPPNIPLSIAIGGIGLAQAAVVASRPVPQFKDGVRGFEGGTAMINDQKGGNYQEIVRTPDGKMRKYSGRDILLNLPKGTDVFSASDTKKMEGEINTMLGQSGINPLGSSLYGVKANHTIIQAPTGGITREEMQAIMEKTLSKQSKQTTILDKKGLTTFVQSGHSKKMILDNKVTFTGVIV